MTLMILTYIYVQSYLYTFKPLLIWSVVCYIMQILSKNKLFSNLSVLELKSQYLTENKIPLTPCIK